MISVHRSELLTCSRCTSGFPLTDIIRCTMSIMGESLCPACHERAHPYCRSIETLVKEDDLKCFHCLVNPASIVCPVCQINDDGQNGLLLCEYCCTSIHLVHKKYHKDHYHDPPKLANSPTTILDISVIDRTTYNQHDYSNANYEHKRI